MTRRMKLIALSLATSTGIALLAISVASASGDNDCSKLKKWTEFGHYSKGDRVWSTSDDSEGSEYRCKKDKCESRMPPSGSSDWERLATCKAKPK